MRKKRYLQLDGLRGLTSLFIVLFHYYTILCNMDHTLIPKRQYLESVFLYSQYGVEIFFTLSGFALAYAYKTKITDLSFGAFLKPRVIKLIIPLLLVDVWITVQSFMYSMLTGIPFQYDAWRHLTSVAMISMGWVENVFPIASVTWFVDVLFLNYILYYLITKFAKSRYQYIGLCGCMILLGYAILVFEFDLPFLYNANGRGYTSFFVGVVLAELWQLGSIQKHRITVKRFGIVSLILIVCAVIGDITLVLGDFDKVFRFFLVPVLMGNLLVNERLKCLFETPLFQKLGKISMAIYFSHSCYLLLLKYLNEVFSLGLNFSSLRVCLIVMVSVLPIAVGFNFLLQKSMSLVNNYMKSADETKRVSKQKI